jgi:hypothetical protein
VPRGARQVTVKADVTVDDQDFLLYGKVDHLGGPWATDIKWTDNYEFPKFKDSAQHPLYLHCLPSVPSFRYLICEDGRRVYEEVYQQGDANALDLVRDFMGSLKLWPEAWTEFDAKWRAYE